MAPEISFPVFSATSRIPRRSNQQHCVSLPFPGGNLPSGPRPIWRAGRKNDRCWGPAGAESEAGSNFGCCMFPADFRRRVRSRPFPTPPPNHRPWTICAFGRPHEQARDLSKPNLVPSPRPPLPDRSPLVPLVLTSRRNNPNGYCNTCVVCSFPLACWFQMKFEVHPPKIPI